MLLYIIRHGETMSNAERRIQGWSDVPLNQKGRALARITSEGLKDVPFDLAITSPLSRAVETAELVIGERKIPVLKDQRIIEFNLGVWEGLLAEDIRKMSDAEAYDTFFGDAMQFQGAPGGESTQQVLERTKGFFEELIQNPEYQDKTILISSHGGTIRALLHNIYEDKNDFWQGRGVPMNCAVNIVSVSDGKATLLEEDKIYYDPENIDRTLATL